MKHARKTLNQRNARGRKPGTTSPREKGRIKRRIRIKKTGNSKENNPKKQKAKAKAKARAKAKAKKIEETNPEIINPERKRQEKKRKRQRNLPKKTKRKSNKRRKAEKIAKKLRKQAKRNKKEFGRKNAKASNATVNLTCLTTAIQLLKFQKDNVNNFLSRQTRQLKQNALTTKKQGKKGEFAEPAARLIQAGGGNKSNMTCGGSTTSTGAKQLLNLTNLLDGCSAAIKKECTPPSGINQTFMSECYEKSKGFNTTLSGSDPCSCFTDTKLVGAMTNLKPCKGKDEAKLAAKARTACLTQMRACNSYVELAGRLQYT